MLRAAVLSDLAGLFAAWNWIFAQAREQALASTAGIHPGHDWPGSPFELSKRPIVASGNWKSLGEQEFVSESREFFLSDLESLFAGGNWIFAQAREQALARAT